MILFLFFFHDRLKFPFSHCCVYVYSYLCILVRLNIRLLLLVFDLRQVPIFTRLGQLNVLMLGSDRVLFFTDKRRAGQPYLLEWLINPPLFFLAKA